MAIVRREIFTILLSCYLQCGQIFVYYSRTKCRTTTLINDHPSYKYDHISCDGQCFLCVRSLTDDHPSNATNDRVKWYFLPCGWPLQVQCISKNHGWRFNIRSQRWISTMLSSDTFKVIQLLWTFFYFGDATTMFSDRRTLHRYNVASPPALRHLCSRA